MVIEFFLSFDVFDDGNDLNFRFFSVCVSGLPVAIVATHHHGCGNNAEYCAAKTTGRSRQQCLGWRWFAWFWHIPIPYFVWQKCATPV